MFGSMAEQVVEPVVEQRVKNFEINSSYFDYCQY
jgi:hypothetical protein